MVIVEVDMTVPEVAPKEEVVPSLMPLPPKEGFKMMKYEQASYENASACDAITAYKKNLRKNSEARKL